MTKVKAKLQAFKDMKYEPRKITYHNRKAEIWSVRPSHLEEGIYFPSNLNLQHE